MEISPAALEAHMLCDGGGGREIWQILCYSFESFPGRASDLGHHIDKYWLMT